MRYGDSARPFHIFFAVLLTILVVGIVTIIILLEAGVIKAPPHKYDPANSKTTPVPIREIH